MVIGDTGSGGAATGTITFSNGGTAINLGSNSARYDIRSGADIMQTAAFSAGSLALSAQTGVALGSLTNSIGGALAGSSAANGFAVKTSGNITVGDVAGSGTTSGISSTGTGAGVTLFSVSGSINQTGGGAISTTGTLTTTANGGITLARSKAHV